MAEQAGCEAGGVREIGQDGIQKVLGSPAEDQHPPFRANEGLPFLSGVLFWRILGCRTIGYPLEVALRFGRQASAQPCCETNVRQVARRAVLRSLSRRWETNLSAISVSCGGFGDAVIVPRAHATVIKN